MFNVKEDLLAYGTTGNNLANIKILRLRKIKSLFNSIYNNPNITIEEIISSLNDVLIGFDEQDFKSAFNFVDSYLSEITDFSDTKKFYTILFVIKYMMKQYCKSRSEYHILDSVNQLLSKIEYVVNSHTELLNNPAIDSELCCIGNTIEVMRVRDIGYDDTHVTVYYISPLAKAKTVAKVPLTESVSSSGTIVKAITNYSTTKSFPQLTRKVFDPDNFVTGLFTESDEDYIVNKAYKLDDYVLSKVKDYNICESYRTIFEYFYGRFSRNSTGLSILKDSLQRCIDRLKNVVPNNIDQEETIQKLISMCKEDISRVTNTLDCIDEKCIEVSSNPLFEMGFGYIYDILPSDINLITEDTADLIGKELSEAVIEYDSLNVISEGIGSIMKRDEEFMDQKRRDKYEMKQKRKQDKYDEKRRRKEEKYEEKKKEKIQKSNRTRTADLKWKTVKLSTPIVYSAIRALKRLIVAAGLSGVSYASGMGTVFIPIMYLISRYLGDKRFPSAQKRKIMMEIRENIQQIDARIEQAERQDDMKQKYKLMKMKNKMESLYNRYNFLSGRGEVL